MRQGERRRHRVALVGLTALMLMGSTAYSDVASAAKPAITAVGSVNCETTSGKVSIKPGLTTAPQSGARTMKMKLKATCTGTTGDAAVQVTGAKLTATRTGLASTTCGTEFAASPTAPGFVADVKWKAKGGRIKPTHIVWSNRFWGVVGPQALDGFMTLYLPDLNASGTGVSTGSWAGSDAFMVLKANYSLSSLGLVGNPCNVKGLKKLYASSYPPGGFGPGGFSLNL
jgi:hypothetical protein